VTSRYDYVVVGSGFFGAVFAQQAHEAGKSVLVIERRRHLGGNCHTYSFEDTGIILHSYGTHIFHTSNRAVWDYVNRFSEFNRYQHRVLTTCRERVYSLPINLGTINVFYGLNLTPQEARRFLEEKRERIAHPRNLEEKAMSLIGRDLYEAFIKGYTRKQWGCDPTELPASIINRLPVRTSFFDSYYDDVFQGIPVGGYTPIFERMLEGIPVELGVDFLEDRDYWARRCGQIVYTGPIDRYFGHSLGRLSWRSVRFEIERLPLDDFQGTSVMNYADEEVAFTRIHEPKHLHLEQSWNRNETVIVREYAQTNDDEPYYPVNFQRDQALFEAYSALERDERNVIFGGRLARYKYYDMHQVIAASLATARRALSGAAIAEPDGSAA